MDIRGSLWECNWIIKGGWENWDDDDGDDEDDDDDDGGGGGGIWWVDLGCLDMEKWTNKWVT